MNVDTAWYLQVNSWARDTPLLHTLLAGYALWGGLALLAVFLIYTWWWARGHGSRVVAASVLTGASTVLALLVNQVVVSPLIARARPCQALRNVEVLLTCSPDFSMPSDHCVIAGAFAAGLYLLRRGLGVVAILAALLVAFSRVYVGVHYPMDTVVGLCAGACVALLVLRLACAPATRLVDGLAGTRYRVLVAEGDNTRPLTRTSKG